MRNFIPKKITGWRSKSINALIDCVTMLYPLSTPTIRREFTTHGVKLNAYISDSNGGENWSFDTSCSVKTFTIHPGHVNIWNLKVHAVNGGTVTTNITVVYGGSAESVWACIKVPLDSSVTPTAVVVPSAYPVPDSTYIYWPLAEYEYSSLGASYSLKTILHRGDINLTGPIAWQ